MAVSCIIQKRGATLLHSSAWLVAQATEFLIKHGVCKLVRPNAVTSNTGVTESLFAVVV
jgi:hypothetical protein